MSVALFLPSGSWQFGLENSFSLVRNAEWAEKTESSGSEKQDRAAWGDLEVSKECRELTWALKGREECRAEMEGSGR